VRKAEQNNSGSHLISFSFTAAPPKSSGHNAIHISPISVVADYHDIDSRSVSSLSFLVLTSSKCVMKTPFSTITIFQHRYDPKQIHLHLSPSDNQKDQCSVAGYIQHPTLIYLHLSPCHIPQD
jgi:hypothetical protein